jgi:acyl-CoA synthetase (AMP-forming)/AMP-acid ligase II
MTDHLGWPLERAARLRPHDEAVVDSERRWTYAELRSRVARFDQALTGLGLEQGDVVAVLATNCAEHLVCWLAVPRSGRVLNPLNHRLAPAELELILNDAQAKVLVVGDTFRELGERLAHAVPSVERVIDPAAFERFSTTGEEAPVRDLDPDTVAGIFYTGGTTGLPKGAMLSHRNLVQNTKQALIALRFTEDDTYLHAAPMFHLADAASLYAITWVGARHAHQRAFEPAGWLEIVAREHVTCGLLVPTMVTMILDRPEIHTLDLTALRTMLYGASPMPEPVLRRAMELLPCDWMQAYGMTEAAPILTVLSAKDHRNGIDDPARAHRLGAAGRPVVGVEVEVRRPDGSVCDTDESGEIYARGPNIMRGYHNRPEETAQALTPGGWYRSGDAGRIDADGYLYIVDRVKDMIVSGGENVYSTEVENALYRHPSVLECAAFGIPDDRWGERVHATVVLRDGHEATAEELVDHCRAHIAGYKLPRSVAFADALPKSGAGKILKRDLREPYWAAHDRRVS